MGTATSDLTTSRSSSSSSATTSRAARNAFLARPAALPLLAWLAILLPTAGGAAAAAPCAPLALAPRLAAPQAGDIFLRAGSVNCDTIEVEIAAHTLPGIFTVAFDLGYAAGVLRYEGYAQGPLLVRGTPRQAPLFLVRPGGPGVLQVSMTRFAPDPSVSAEGSEGLVRLRFSKVAAGSSTIDFLGGPESSVPERILDGEGQVVAARFTPGHGATVTVPP